MTGEFFSGLSLATAHSLWQVMLRLTGSQKQKWLVYGPKEDLDKNNNNNKKHSRLGNTDYPRSLANSFHMHHHSKFHSNTQIISHI